MKRTVALILVLAIFVLGGNCMAENLITVEELLQKAGIAPESVADLSVIQRFIEERDFDPYIFEEIPAELVKKYVTILMAGLPISYSHIVDGAGEDASGIASYSDITSILMTIRRDANVLSLVIDRDNSIAYLSSRGYIIDDVCYAEKTIDLTDEAMDSILERLSTADVLNFEREYVGDETIRVASQLTIGSKNGSITSSIYGGESDAPNEFFGICDWLFTYCNELNT